MAGTATLIGVGLTAVDQSPAFGEGNIDLAAKLEGLITGEDGSGGLLDSDELDECVRGITRRRRVPDKGVQDVPELPENIDQFVPSQLNRSGSTSAGKFLMQILGEGSYLGSGGMRSSFYGRRRGLWFDLILILL
jgi:hypothetical protein